MKKGITLITLVITIVIMLIVLSTVVVSTVTITNNSKKTTFAKDLKTIEEAVISEYTTSGVLPVVSDIPIDIAGMTDNPETLALELAENGDTSSAFYEVDWSKIGIKNSSRGTKKNGNDNDVYVVSSDNLNIYYAPGIKVGGKTYFSLTSALIKGTKIAKKTNEGTGITSDIFANGIKLSKDKKIWTNDLAVTVELTLAEGETASYTIAGVAVTNPVTINTGITKIPLNATTITGDALTAFNGATQVNKIITITKSKAGVDDVTATMNISNLDIVVPDTASVTAALVANTNDNVLTFSGMTDTAGSGIKEIRYEYVTKLNSNNVDESAYNPQPTIDSTYIQTSGKKSNSIDKISIPKHISSIAVTWIDAAGNVGPIKNYTIPVPSLIKEVAVNSLDGYVKDGLVLQYDGINNGGTGIHNDNTSTNKAVWKDLSGNGNDGTLSSLFKYTENSGWTSNSIKFDETDVTYVSITTPILITTGKWTIETYIKLLDTASWQHIIANSWSEFFGYHSTAGIIYYQQYYNNFAYITSTNTTPIFGQKQYMMLRHNLSDDESSANISFRIDNNTYNYTKTSLPENKKALTLRYISDTTSTRKMTGNLYAIRVYNRVLTDQEIKQNYANDLKRFGV